MTTNRYIASESKLFHDYRETYGEDAETYHIFRVERLTSIDRLQAMECAAIIYKYDQLKEAIKNRLDHVEKQAEIKVAEEPPPQRKVSPKFKQILSDMTRPSGIRKIRFKR